MLPRTPARKRRGEFRLARRSFAFIGWQLCVQAKSGVQEFRSSGVQEFRSSGVQEFRSSGVQEFRVGRQTNLQVNKVLPVTFHLPQVSGRTRFLRCKAGWLAFARFRHSELLFHLLADKNRLQAPPRTSKEPTILQDTNPWNICSRSCS